MEGISSPRVPRIAHRQFQEKPGNTTGQVQPGRVAVAKSYFAKCGRGAVWDGKGVEFAVYAEGGGPVELVLFDASRRLVSTYTLYVTEGNVYRHYVRGIAPGTRYAFRIGGDGGQLLLDPYATAVDHPGVSRDSSEPISCTFDVQGSYRGPLAVVTDAAYTWKHPKPRQGSKPLVIYETHVRGFTKTNQAIPKELQGTYAGLAHPASIAYLKKLHVSAVELLPVHMFIDRPYLTAEGRRNYWGYDPIVWSAPEGRYRTHTEPETVVREFKEMVDALHGAGIKVILDVVYNHTSEGGTDGLTLSLKGLAPSTYYHRTGQQYWDITGCGNTVNLSSSEGLKVVLDSLRYWVEEMHVDGFRFDEAPALFRRSPAEPARWNAFADALYADPVLSKVLLIAEPWDASPTGYWQGRFPARWMEWNGRFRDAVRDFWRGQASGVAEFATRLAGSSDLFKERGPLSSVNFIACHDGMTARDLVSYERKHNEANGENNRDGADDNRSANYGIEGPSSDASLEAFRLQQQRNLLATVALAQGTPMLLAGDERSRSQLGNNNAYNQDSPLSWIDWAKGSPALEKFVERAFALRAAHPALRRTSHFTGEQCLCGSSTDVAWRREDGAVLNDTDWKDTSRRTLGMHIHDHHGTHLDEVYIMVNNADSDGVWKLPAGEWEAVLDTRSEDGAPRVKGALGGTVSVAAHSILVISRPKKL
ncbi:MAG: glycogen debranching protein GlgX [Candidatus Dormibacteria bacterium]